MTRFNLLEILLPQNRLEILLQCPDTALVCIKVHDSPVILIADTNMTAEPDGALDIRYEIVLGYHDFLTRRKRAELYPVNPIQQNRVNLGRVILREYNERLG